MNRWSPGVPDQPGQRDETPSLQKVKKVLGGDDAVVPATGEAEVGR